MHANRPLHSCLTLTVLFALVLLVAPAAHAQDATATAEPLAPWTCPDGFAGQTLSVYNWALYIADDTLANFEAACGVTVTYATYVNNEALLERVQGGYPLYDVIVPSDYMVEIMIAQRLLTPLDHSLLPNLDNLSADLLDPPYDPGNAYSVPYQWGTTGIAYRVAAVETPPERWADLFSFDGRVGWIEDQREMLAAALLQLGYPTSTSDPRQIAEAGEWLMAHMDNVTAISRISSQELLLTGVVDMVVDYSGNAYQLLAACACDDYGYVIPADGASVWIDNLAIPANAPNPALAHAFIDYILHPQVSADISNTTSFGSPNQTALDAALLDAALLDNPNIYPPADVRARLYFLEAVNLEAAFAYNAVWEQVKAALLD